MNQIARTSLGILLLILLVYTNGEPLRTTTTAAPLAPRLLAQSGARRLLADNRSASTANLSFYDDYYEYDQNETSDKAELTEYNDYLDDYTEPFEKDTDVSKPIRKLGTCPKVVEAIGQCDEGPVIQPDCRFDTDCPGDLKCCAAACGKRTCKMPIQVTISTCPTSFQCSLNCRLGYRVDSNGCLVCECQSCPAMDQCHKHCPSGYLKDLFNCDICECRDQCPPFACSILCPTNVGFAQAENGCPLCQCATSQSQPIESTSSCQKDVHCPVGFRCVNDARHVPMCQAVAPAKNVCSDSLPTDCTLQCPNENYLRDSNGCRTCACASSEPKPSIECPKMKCRATCGAAGYTVDENGCSTCTCASKSAVQCSRLMCRMFCKFGFKRDENGCEYCSCNDSPKACPTWNCEQTCSKYRKDYSGCPTCDCDCPAIDCPASSKNCANGFKKDNNGCPTCSCNDQAPAKVDRQCSPVLCDLDCAHGLAQDANGCQLCSCSRCPLQTCRMFCMYGFRRNDNGCQVCECDWSPIGENIQCSERIACPGTRVCNLNLKLCETVDPDRVNWFVYDFEVRTDLFQDQKFVQTFKNGLIHNIATKYNLKVTQVTVSAVETTGVTSFQIMPHYAENMEEFQNKIDQIDLDLNSHEFRTVLPAIVRAIEDGSANPPTRSVMDKFREKWSYLTAGRRRFILYPIIFLVVCAAIAILMTLINCIRRPVSYSNLSDSKSPIYDTPYHKAPTEDDQYHAVHAPDGTAYVIVQGEDGSSTNDKRALV